MDTNTRDHYTCQKWQPDNPTIPANEFLRSYETSFYIKVVLQKKSTKLTTNSTPDLTEAFEDAPACWVSYNQLIDPQKEPSNLNNFVSLSHGKLENFPDIVRDIVRQISLFSQDMMRDPSNVWQHIIPMYILISLDANLYEEIAEEDYRESSTECLDYFNIKKGDPTEPTCVICLEELSARMVVARTPCEHLYHWTCICIWLSKSNSCPMCRFEPVMII